MAGHVERAFASYRKRVIPDDAPDLQVEECRKAFYAGACIMLLNVSVEAPTTDAHRQLIQQLQAECDAFAIEMLRSDHPTIH